MGGRVVAIEGGFGVTVTQDVTAVGPGQFEFFTAVPSEAGIVVTCSTPVGSCTPDSLPDNRWQFTAPSTGGSTVTLTVTATLNGRVKNTNVIYTIAAARLDSVRIFSSRASGDALPGEVVTVTAVAQSANGSVPPVQIEPRNLLGAGATVGSPVSAPNQPLGTARVSRLYTAPKSLPQRSAEQFAASFPATAVAPPLPTVTNTRSLNVAALTLNAPLSICAAGSISASATSNLVSGTFSWQLNAETPVTGPSFFRNGAVGGNLRLDLQSNGVTVKTQNIGVTTAGCTLAVVPGYISLLPGQTQQFTTNPSASNLSWQASHGSITPAGLYTAPPAQPTSVLAQVYAMNNSQVIGTGFVQLTSNVTLSMTPPSVTLGPGQAQTFTYSLSPAGAGVMLEYSGVYAPVTSNIPGQITISTIPGLDVLANTYLKVISNADYTKTAESYIQFRPNVGISVNAPNGATALRPNRQTQVNATLTGVRDTSVTWELIPNVGIITGGGLYTAPATIAATQTISVRATSVVDPTKSAATTLTLKPPVFVSISPTSVGPLYANATQQFTASVTGAGSPNTAVTWSAGDGTISPNGLYTAPTNIANAYTINVRATSVEDSETSASATVRVGSGKISISPDPVWVRPYESVQFSASLPSADAVPPLTWWVQNSSGASITQTGLYTAPAMVFETTNTSAGANVIGSPNNLASAWVILTPAPALWVGPVDPVNGYGPTQSFNFRATDSAGASNIDTITATFQTLGAAFPECQVLYTPSSGNLKLLYRYYDNYWGWYVSFYNGQVGGPVSGMNNGNCSVTSAYASANANLVTLTLGMSFTPGPEYQVSRAATNLQGQSTGSNILAGTWRTQPLVAVTVSPNTTNLGANGQQQFGVSVSGTTNTAVTWSVIAGAGSINSIGRYTAPASIVGTSATVRATSAADPSKSADALINLSANSAIAVTMLTPTATVTAGQSFQLGASVTGKPNPERIWTIVGGPGTINQSSGLYTAPAVVSTSATASVRATSVADPARFATATLTVNPSAVTVSVSPTSATLTAGASAQFTAVVGGTVNPAVTWSVSPASAGTVNSNGYFTAGSVSALTSAVLTATSVVDSSKSAGATLSIQPQSPVTIVSFAPTSTSGLESVLTLTGRSTQAPVSLWIAVGAEYPQPYPFYLPCSFYYSSAGGGLAWTHEAEGSAAYITNYSCAVTLNSIDYNPSTGNRTLNVTVSYYSSIWGTQPIKARVTSPSGFTNWTTVGTWIP